MHEFPVDNGNAKDPLLLKHEKLCCLSLLLGMLRNINAFSLSHNTFMLYEITALVLVDGLEEIIAKSELLPTKNRPSTIMRHREFRYCSRKRNNSAPRIIIDRRGQLFNPYGWSSQIAAVAVHVVCVRCIFPVVQFSEDFAMLVAFRLWKTRNNRVWWKFPQQISDVRIMCFAHFYSRNFKIE